MPIENIVAAAELSAVTDPVGNCMGLSCAHGARRVIIRARSSATAPARVVARIPRRFVIPNAPRKRRPDASRGAWFFRAGACMKD
ncbi:hypothetical protein [Burkholderia multivorans]|uniref:hypothetical protein n=1 Tax=Burkholderia multivorans TaxID=87883 RepID=UPI0021592213|nr:hypothetical protein [Burkholderia multivorans]